MNPAFPNSRIYGHRARIGYTSPPLTTEIFPYEFYKIVPDGVTLVVTTLAIVERSKSEVEQSYAISIGSARDGRGRRGHRRAGRGADQSFARGEASRKNDQRACSRARRQSLDQRVRAGARPAKLGCKKAIVVQPYAASETDRIAGYGRHFGCEILGATAWGSAFNHLGRIPVHAALEMARALMREHPAADSILLPSPHWPVIGAIDPLEREFGVNVVSALAAVVWDALRRVGVDDRIAGYGRLLREF